MPILDDIMDHDVLGPTFREGLQKGLEQGLQQGAQQGELAIIRRLIHKRFGGIPTWVEERLANLSTVELEDLSVRLFRCPKHRGTLPFLTPSASPEIQSQVLKSF